MGFGLPAWVERDFRGYLGAAFWPTALPGPAVRTAATSGGEMRILAFLTDPPVVSAILLHLDLPHRSGSAGSKAGV
jgi:hypothetical protein